MRGVRRRMERAVRVRVRDRPRIVVVDILIRRASILNEGESGYTRFLSDCGV